MNTLQLNTGVTPAGDVGFSEIAHLAGVAYTDWSWSALFGDFDNDGYKDIFITNGYPKAVNDFDYQMAVYRARGAGDNRRSLQILKDLPGYKVSNYLFRNNGDLTFSDQSVAWGMNHPGFAYGAAYADLENTGRLDLVVNHIDAAASIYRNVQPQDDAHHYLRVVLHGLPPNRRGIGSTLILTAGGQNQYLYQSPYRGFMSTVDDRPHFGLGHATRVDTLEVIWPDGRSQRLTGLDADRTVILKQGEATERAPEFPSPGPKTRAPFLRSHERIKDFRHQIWRDARAVIFDLNDYDLRSHRLLTCDTDIQLTARNHGFNRVYQDVEEELL